MEWGEYKRATSFKFHSHQSPTTPSPALKNTHTHTKKESIEVEENILDQKTFRINQRKIKRKILLHWKLKFFQGSHIFWRKWFPMTKYAWYTPPNKKIRNQNWRHTQYFPLTDKVLARNSTIHPQRLIKLTS